MDLCHKLYVDVRIKERFRLNCFVVQVADEPQRTYS